MKQIALSPDQKRLLAEMRKINYGSFRNFDVRNGALVLPKCLETSREMYSDCRHRNKPCWDDETHASLPEVADLFAQFMIDTNIRVQRLHFTGGLPDEIDYVLQDEQAEFNDLLEGDF